MMTIKTYLGAISIWLLSIIVLYFGGLSLGYLDHQFNAINLLQWDANWYNSLMFNGYEYVDSMPCNAGFFPFFSFIWYILGLSGFGISLLNLAFFIGGLWYLVKHFQPSMQQLLLVISLPSMFFLYVPYSEALYFVFSSLLLVGLQKKSNYLILLGVFFASLTRPTFLFFVPAFAVLFLFEIWSVQIALYWKISKKYLFYYILPAIVAIILITIIQYMQTGVWFAYFKAQSGVWLRAFRLPTLPFGSTASWSLLWIEAISFWMGTFATILIAYFSYTRLIKRVKLPVLAPAFLFSLVYLMMAFLSIVFFNPTWEINRTVLNGINRYMFVNPFLLVVLWQIGQYLSIRYKDLIYLLLASFLLWLLMSYYYLHIGTLLYFLAITVYILLYVLFIKHKKNLPLIIALLVINCVGQVYLLHRFLGGEWVS